MTAMTNRTTSTPIAVRRAAPLVACSLLALGLVAQPRPATGDALLAPGVSAALARHRARTLRDVRYDVALALPSDKAAPVTGTTMLRFTRRGGGDVVIDFDATPAQVRGVEVNGRDVGALAPVNGHLVIPARRLRAGANRVTVRFVAGDVPLNRSDDFLYTIFVPARARQAMPVFDQPDLKARLTLALEMPRAWAATANGAELVREGTGERVTVRFAETKPLPTYLLAFAAGRFEVDSAVRDGRTIRVFHREGDTAKVARNRDAILDLHARAIRWMEDYTGIRYPWGKFDVFLAPAFQFGGMEHAGAIFYNASGLMLDATATQNQRLGRASVIAHEVAHLWFGDLVTMRWFDDVWLKEVFANFFAAKMVNPSFPEVNHPLRFFLSHHPAAYDVDRTAGANPIRQPLDNLAEAGSLYGAIIYQKAPIMMRQLELLVGEDAFRRAMRTYLARHAYGNATWPELVSILDPMTPTDLRAWSRAWVDMPGRPRLAVRVVPARGPSVDVRRTARGMGLPVRHDTGAAGPPTIVTVAQDDPRGRGLVWPQRIAIAVGDGAGRDTTITTTIGADTAHAGVEWRAAWALPSAAGLAYGEVVLDDASRAALLRTLPALADPLLRGSALVTLEEELQGGRVAPAALHATVLAMLATERDELLVSRALGTLGRLWWRWLDPATRAPQAAAQEGALRAGLARATTPGAKLAWFRALSTTALTPETTAWLTRVWRREEAVPGLALGEDDETALALQLALRERPDARAIVETQRTRIANPDRRARLAFITPAAVGDAAERARFVESLRLVENRRREPWILDGMSLVHHPLRAEASAPLVAPALALLEELQRTGDIFLPKRWLDVTLGGHRSPAVAETVRAYLRDRPTLAPRLRAIVLQSADELFRITGRPAM
jgi:aminopeptidase N